MFKRCVAVEFFFYLAYKLFFIGAQTHYIILLVLYLSLCVCPFSVFICTIIYITLIRLTLLSVVCHFFLPLMLLVFCHSLCLFCCRSPVILFASPVVVQASVLSPFHTLSRWSSSSPASCFLFLPLIFYVGLVTLML